MATIFKYNNKLYQCINLEKKLKRLKINKEDIDILLDDLDSSELEEKYLNLLKEDIEDVESFTDTKLYYYKSKDNQSYIISIYSSIEEMKQNDVGSFPYEQYEPITLELWNKIKG
jgi:hypothetical protein